MSTSYLTNVVATPLLGVCIFGVARSGRRTVPRLQHARIYQTASKKFLTLLACMAVIGGAMPLFAQEGTPNPAVGTLMLEKKTYQLKHALAYETTVYGEEMIVVVLSGQAISSEKLKEAMKRKKIAALRISSGHSSRWISRRRGNSSSGALLLAARPSGGGAPARRQGN